MLDNGTAGYIQQFQDRIQQITNPQTQQNVSPTGMIGQPNASSGYSLNNDYAVGSRMYNGYRSSPNGGGPGSVNPAGYLDRDRMAAVKNNLLTQRLGG